MPVDELRCIRIVVNVDYDSLPFLKADEWPRDLAIVKCGGNDMIVRELDEPSRDMQDAVCPFAFE
jgi:hypothetical protein